jgi:alpha-tubulin suppressor-like RCC1 family protein
VTPKGITTATAVTAGAYHTCALLAGGSMRCWGFNADGQLGNGQTDERNVSIVVVGSAPSIYPVRGLPGSVTAIAGAVGAGVMGLASFGGYHTCALIAGGAVSCWGYGGNGQLGNGSTANSNVPVAVSGITTAIAIAAGAYHSCALLADGTARCWGRNGDGELGDRANSDSTSPVTVFALSRVKEITAGGFHTCAVLTTPGPPGQIWCWGQNNNGELGTGTTSPSNRPVPISGF